MFRITKADIKWDIKIYSLGISSSILTIILSGAYPDYWVPIVYASSGVIIYLMIQVVRKTEWKLPFR